MSTHGLDARLQVDRPGFRLDVDLTVAPGEVLALLGPNGSGKSTALRALAGLTPLADGQVVLAGEDVTRAPTENRAIGMVFQDYLLFAHLSALDNVAFGPRCRGVDKRRARELAAEQLRHMGLDGHERKRPGALSGGQAQRVALARALAAEPRLLLLDEPLSALDAHTRLSVRSQLRRHLSEFDGGTIVVTHDPLEAMVLADRVTIIEEGSVVQRGTPAEVARHPRTEYIAHLVGLNLYRGRADGTTVAVAPSENGGEVTIGDPHDGDVFVSFPPSAVALFRAKPEGSPRNTWRVTVDGVESFGDHVRVHLRGQITLIAEITPAALADLRLTTGDEVWACVKATEITTYPA
nr:ABC transporter ATP-binding protein [Spiractinospora alimapuensis]